VAMASGPSLGFSGLKNVKLPKNVKTFGVNNVSNYMDPDYLIAFDSLEKKGSIYQPWKNSKATKFLSKNHEASDVENVFPILVNKNNHLETWWENEANTWFLASGSSSLLPIQLAAYMGCKQILLVGADFGAYDGFETAWEVGTKPSIGSGLALSYKYDTKRDREIICGLANSFKAKFEEWGIEVVDASFGEYLPFKKLNVENVKDWLG